MGKVTCDLECPKCHKLWGKMKYDFDTMVRASDIRVVDGKKKKFRDGDSLECTCCGYEYNNYDVMLAIAVGGESHGQKKI